MLLYLIDYKSCWRISINMILYLLISFNFCQIIVNCWPLIKDPCVLHALENLVFVGGPVFELSVIFTWNIKVGLNHKNQSFVISDDRLPTGGGSGVLVWDD